MKKLLAALFLVSIAANAAHAELKIIRSGGSLSLDPSSFPADMKGNYEIFRVKCAQCHTLERAITAIQTGVAPISGRPFDSNVIRTHAVKILRSAVMTRAEVQSVIELLNFLLAEKNR